jgi:hypothetical protein
MRIKMTASSEELSIPTGHPLHGTYVRLLVWNYLTEGSEHNGKPSGATFTATPSTPSSHPNALSMHERDINSVLTVQAIADALHALDGHALFEAIQPLISFSGKPPTEEPPTELLPDATKPKPKRGRPPKGTSHNFSGPQEPPTPAQSPSTPSTPRGAEDSTTGTGKNSTIGKKRGRRKKSITMDDTQASHPTSQNDPPTEVRKNRRRST